MYPLREKEVRWDGPDCVKNLYLDTVTQCPPDQEGKGAEQKPKNEKKGKEAAAEEAAAEEEGDERRR